MTPVPLRLRRPHDPDGNNAGSRDDFDVVDGNGRPSASIFKPGCGARDWMWALSQIVRPPLHNHRFAATREQAQAALR